MGFLGKLTGADAKKKAKKQAAAAAAEAARQAAIERSRANIEAIKSKRAELRDARAQEQAGGEAPKYGGSGSLVGDAATEQASNNPLISQGGNLDYLADQPTEGDKLQAFGQSAKPL